MKSPIRRFTLSFTLMALLAVPAMAGDKETHGAEAPDMEEAMAAMAAAGTPGEHHRFLASLEGDWQYSMKVWMAPDQPPMESPGTSKKSMILGGRFLQEEVAGSMGGNPFDGFGITAYDNTAGEFINTWLDSMGTTMLIARGQRDGDTLEMHGEYLNPMSKQMMKVRYVTRKVSDDKHVFEYYMTAPGAEEAKSMEIEYMRAAAE